MNKLRGRVASARSPTSTSIRPSAPWRVGLCLRFNSSSASVGSNPDANTEDNPLRILFCGSDDFSIASLRALHTEHLERPDRIAAIDVVCRPGKRTGRGLKKIREVPIKAAAAQLGIPVHERDTFTGWTPPIPYNLVIAVSFGLLVPARILNTAKYGGLNVHPSMLPDFRGSAPIHHALLHSLTHAGITIQTMHPTRFDAGAILLQTLPPGLPIPQPSPSSLLPCCTPAHLTAHLAPLSATLLLTALRSALFLPSSRTTHPPPPPVLPTRAGAYVPAAAAARPDATLPPRPAPKLTPADARIDWAAMPAATLLRRLAVLGRLWDAQTRAWCARIGAAAAGRPASEPGPPLRVLFEEMRLVGRAWA
ncbi:formyl transferase [Lineolata rhizophorae]|uniref:methionyl-tRNA formyltransferase n=1 Tax=Lineolata rhizophorae TaxID=578093 RepID=A0A6A6PD09_9PEZI|nr:formyl transferase [Lineolata rhizophorae]